jgi:hypothetical protein
MADRQVIVRLQTGGTVPDHRNDAADEASAGRHLVLTVPGSPVSAGAVLRARSGAGMRAGHGRGGELAGAAGPGYVVGLGRCGRRGGIPGPRRDPGEAWRDGRARPRQRASL